jgi:hypothetical protein
MEKEFLAKLDSQAAEALALLELGLHEEAWAGAPRSSWSRFLITQMLRSPEDIAQLKSSVREEWGKAMPEAAEAYAAQRLDTDPPTLHDYLNEQYPGQGDEFAFRIARSIMNHPKVGEYLNNMYWQVIDVPKGEFSLLTSDRPVWMTATITEVDACIIMPIGPSKLFTAVNSLETQRKLNARRRGDLVRDVNKLIVQHAIKYVYGLSDGMKAFVQKNIATKRHSTLLERAAAERGHEIVANWGEQIRPTSSRRPAGGETTAASGDTASLIA